MKQRYEVKSGGKLPTALRDGSGDSSSAWRDPVTGNRRGVAAKATEDRREIQGQTVDEASGPPKSTRRALKFLPLVLGPALGLGVALLRPNEPQLVPLPERVARQEVTQVEPEAVEVLSAAKTDEWTDVDGSLTRLVGRNPVQVLEAFCVGSPDWIAVGIRPTEPERASARYGVVRHRAGGEEHVIGIRADSRGSRWLAGDGMSPIVPQRLAELLNPNPVPAP